MSTLYPSYLDRYRDKVILFLLLCLAAIWNIPNTIAARYICEALLVILLLTCKIHWIDALRKLKILIIFFIYLFIQLLFFSTDFTTAIKNFKSEWMHFLIFSIIGIGSGFVINKSKTTNILLILGTAFAIPLFIHISLVFFKGASIHQIPWGYWGISKIHGDLAYASLQSSILLMAYLLCQKKTLTKQSIAALILILCITSPLIAQSRGGLIFTIIVIFTSIAFFILISKDFKTKKLYLFVMLIMSLLIGIIAIKISVQSDPVRWSNLILKTKMGFSGNPNIVFCNGIDSLERDILQKRGAISSEERKVLNTILDGDGARVMAAQSGIELIPKNLMGIDGSKQAYQIAISNYCESAPKIFISHTHNAWIDTSLAIGVIGAFTLMTYYITLATLGFRNIIQNNRINPFSFALFISAFIWFLRGLLDSTLRDQILEMQAFILPFLFILSYKFVRK